MSNKSKKAVFIACDSNYFNKSIVALNSFVHHNSGYDKYIICMTHDSNEQKFLESHDIKILSVDLSEQFQNLDKRKNKKYPLECYYHFYAYILLHNYDYLVKIEPDIFTLKKLPFDFSKITYIGGGGTQKYTINNFSPLMKDKNSINKFFDITANKHNLNQKRILGGTVIYNVQNLKKISFFQKIVDLYKKSFKYDCQRDGDDSLLSLYQMIYPQHFYIVDWNLCNRLLRHVDEQIKNDQNIYMVHFLSKPWKKYNENHSKYFFFAREKYIEYLYNNFNNTFINNNFKDIYSNINITKKINIYFYLDKIHNFGDMLIPYLVKKYCNSNDYNLTNQDSSDYRIISCGSIMRLYNNKTIIYGSGIRDKAQNLQSGGIVKFTRGPATRNCLAKSNGWVSDVYGDPGLLMPLYYNKNIEKKYSLGIVPHYVHYDKIKNLYKNDKNIIIIDVTKPNIEHVIDDITSCHKIVSSSLHGLIISDSYKIPNGWIKYDNKIRGDDTKFHDYLRSVNRNIKYIDATKNNYIPQEKLFNSVQKYCTASYNIEKLKNAMFFDENGIKPYTKYLWNKFISRNKHKKNINAQKNVTTKIIPKKKNKNIFATEKQTKINTKIIKNNITNQNTDISDNVTKHQRTMITSDQFTKNQKLLLEDYKKKLMIGEQKMTKHHKNLLNVYKNNLMEKNNNIFNNPYSNNLIFNNQHNVKKQPINTSNNVVIDTTPKNPSNWSQQNKNNNYPDKFSGLFPYKLID